MPSVWTRQGLRTDSQPWPLLTGGPAVRPGVCLSRPGARRWLWRDRVSGGGPSPGSTGSSRQGPGPGHSRSGQQAGKGKGKGRVLGAGQGGVVDEAEMKPGPGKGLLGSPPGLGPAARCQRRCDPSPKVQTSPPTQGSHQHAPLTLANAPCEMAVTLLPDSISFPTRVGGASTGFPPPASMCVRGPCAERGDVAAILGRRFLNQ